MIPSSEFPLGVKTMYRAYANDTNFEINEKGITVEKVQYPYTSLESFWVEENVGLPKVLVKSKKVMMPYIILPIEGVEPSHIREYLAQYLPEEEHHEPLLQYVMEYLGF